MSSWRLDLTVLADLAASMFAACFMVLLIFLSLAQKADTRPPRPIEASQELNLVERRVLAPAELVDLLHHHAAPEGTSIDLFADRIEVHTAAGTHGVKGEEIAAALSTAAEPLRLYVFSNALYHDVAAAVANRPVTEMSVPRALKGPDGTWRLEFLALAAEHAPTELFRQRLAQLLDGGVEGKKSAADGQGASAASPSLVERTSAMLAALAAIGFPLLGLCAVVLIERRRFRSGQTIAVREHSAQP